MRSAELLATWILVNEAAAWAAFALVDWVASMAGAVIKCGNGSIDDGVIVHALDGVIGGCADVVTTTLVALSAGVLLCRLGTT